ncbi:hypothetical protein [Methylomonas sp. CM2]|uniref:hypothetical protein n=1 Tax=Methylomonas sp. CM2 TaxID=3417647 RepID=UPI003CE895D7
MGFSLLYIIHIVPVSALALEFVMLAVLASVSQAFEAQLDQRNVPDQQHHAFRIWFWFYLDFCNKPEAQRKLCRI